MFSENIIDRLYPATDGQKKPRTYRQKARKAYLAVVKRRRPAGKVLRRGLKQQLQYLRRNLGHIERLLEHWPEGAKLPLPWLATPSLLGDPVCLCPAVGDVPEQ